MTRTKEILQDITVERCFDVNKLATYLASLEEKTEGIRKANILIVNDKGVVESVKVGDVTYVPKEKEPTPSEEPGWKGRWYAFNKNYISSINYHAGNPPSVVEFIEEEKNKSYEEGWTDANEVRI